MEHSTHAHLTYIIRKHSFKTGQFQIHEWRLRQEVFMLQWPFGNPGTGNPDTGYPDTGYPDTGYPDTGNPDTGNPDTGNPNSCVVRTVPGQI